MSRVRGVRGGESEGIHHVREERGEGGQTWIHWIPNIQDAKAMVNLLSLSGAHLVEEQIEMIDVNNSREEKLKTTNDDSDRGEMVDELLEQLFDL
jgi:hypothetical protein